MRLEDVPWEALEELGEQIDDLRHDLGKYVVFEVRFVGRDAADTETLRAALQRDLLRTYSHRGEEQSAWAVWSRLCPALLAGDPDVEAITEAMTGLRGVDLVGGGREALLSAVLRAEAVSAACRRLSQRVQGRLAGAESD